MKAVILAGGKGTRLGDLAKDIPKPMVRICGKPILEHQIDVLKRYGVKDFILLVHYLGEVIEDYFGDGSNFGVNISYFYEKEALSTAGALKEVEEQLNEDFLLLYGDVMLDVNFAKFIDFHFSKKGCATLAVHPNDHPHDSDLIELSMDAKVNAFYPKPHAEGKFYRNMVNAALYVMSPAIFRYIEKGVKADLGRDVFPKIYKEVSLYGYNTAEYIKDVGTPGRLSEVSKDFENGKIKRLNSQNKRKCVFLDRDGVINKEVNLLHDVAAFELLPSVAEAIFRLNQSEFLAVCVTNQPVIARGLCAFEELNQIHAKMDTLLAEDRAKLDALYFCPHHPDKGFEGEVLEYKVECECRKPGIGMIKKAQEDFNIDLDNSYIIGDSFRDILCGANAGLITIGVRTGHGVLDGECEPDYIFDNLGRAIDFILSE